MRCSRYGEFTRWRVREIRCSGEEFRRCVSSRDSEFRRCGVVEMGSSADVKFTRVGVDEMEISRDGEFTI